MRLKKLLIKSKPSPGDAGMSNRRKSFLIFIAGTVIVATAVEYGHHGFRAMVPLAVLTTLVGLALLLKR
jgi:hypothetical protein